MHVIKSIAFRRILNSHVDFTTEFNVALEEGNVGRAASPRGETISIYEDRNTPVDPQSIINQIEREGCVGKPFDQEGFDAYLETRIDRFGRNNAYGLSLAFFEASRGSDSSVDLFGRRRGKLEAPRICCNILNGGWHAYTNPVLSDFSEYLLVATSNDIAVVIGSHNEIQRVVKEKLLSQPKTVVAGNPVNRFVTEDNRECIDFLLKILDELGFSAQFDLMIDASGTDLGTEEGYQLALTDKSFYSSDRFREYWLNLIRQYDISFLEDPFHEKDDDAWHFLTNSQETCKIIGDNYYSSSAERIARGAGLKRTHGVVIKPNQSGTVSAVRKAVETAQRHGQIVISSHRSISTEETFLSTLTSIYEVPFIKIGPLISDYSSVMRLNEIIRLTS